MLKRITQYPAVPSAPGASRLASVAVDLLAMAGLIALLLAVVATPWAQVAVVPHLASSLFALATGAVGGMAAILAALVGRLTDDRRATWIGVSLVLYSLVGVPASSLESDELWENAAIGNVRLTAHISVVLLLCLATRRTGVLDRWSGRVVIVAGLFVATLAILVGKAFPERSLVITGFPPLKMAVAVGGIVVGMVIAAHGWRGRNGTRAWLGLGFAVIGLAHAGRIGIGLPIAQPGLAFAGVRLLGVVLVALALGRLAVRALLSVDQRQQDQQEQLLLAEADLRRAAEQEHEMRNGLAGLAGAAQLPDVPPDQAALLQAAVTSELARLGELLCDADDGRRPRQVYLVDAVLGQQVALRAGTGMDVRLDADPGLRAEGSAATLAQVVANVLANCAAHAPGSPVRIQAGRSGTRVFVRVTDFGPGIAADLEPQLFLAGARRPGSAGKGLGLAISRRLLLAEGGALTVRARRPGCTVRIELKATEIEAAPVLVGPGLVDTLPVAHR